MPKLHSKHINRLLFAFIVVSVTGGVFLYWIMGSRAKDSLIEQTLLRQQVVVRAGARSIKSFMDFLGNAVYLLSLSNELDVTSVNSQESLDKFISDWKETPVVGVILTDEKGVVRFNSNKYHKPSVGGDVSDREYFAWAKRAQPGHLHFSKPMGARLGSLEGQGIITVSAPLLRNDKFSGVVSVAVLLSELTEIHLEPLKVFADSNVHLLDSDGVLLNSSSFPELIGINIFDYSSETPFPKGEPFVHSLQRLMEEKREGRFVAGPFVASEQADTLNLVVVSPFSFYGKDWFLSISTPEHSAVSYYDRFQRHQVVALVFIIIIILGISAIGILGARVAQKDAYLDGFTVGRNHAEDHLRAKKKTSRKK